MTDTNKVVHLERQAKPEDYVEWKDGLWRLSWQDRLAPGVTAYDPVEGAREYNHYQNHIKPFETQKALTQLQQSFDFAIGHRGQAASRLVATEFLSALEPDYYQINDALNATLNDLPYEQSLHFFNVFYRRVFIKEFLTSDDVLALKSCLSGNIKPL